MAQKKPNKNGLSRDELEMDEAYYGLTGRKPKAKKSRNNMVYLAIGLAVVLVAAIGLALGLALKSDGDVLGPVRIGSIDLEGLTTKQARAQLKELAQVYEDTPMTVMVMDQVITIYPDNHMSGLDVDAIVRDAKKVSAKDGVTNLDIVAYLGIDEISIRQTLLPLEQAYGVTPSKTQWSVTGQDPDPNDPLDAGSKKLVVTMGVPDYGLDMDKLYQLILQGYRHENFYVSMECSVVEPEIPDLEDIYSLVCTDSADAIVDEKTFEITPEVYGYGFDLPAALAALQGCPYGETMEFPFLPKIPELTQEMVEQELYGDILGEYKTPHTPESNRNVNLRLACEAINGTIVLPGETFSFNKALGERTEERGYKPAASYVNGLTVDTVGGGICQVSSTLYYVCLLSDMDIVVRAPHGYVSSYIPMGMDASVSWGSQDYKFKNSNATPIRIEAWMEGGYVNVRIWGQETRDYYVELYYEELSSEPYDVVYKEYPPDNKDGYEHGDVIITPYTGYTVKTYKKLINRETGKTIKTVFITDTKYSKRDKVICLIVDPTQTTPPETTPPETSPAETTPPETTPAETVTTAATT
ncbi:MAG: VanW family protein [Faecousia sp.]